MEIKYPSAQIITSYEITSRNDATNTRFPKVWKLQGSVSDGTTWVDIGSELNSNDHGLQVRRNAFSVTNTTAYQYYRLYITTTIRGASTPSTSDFAAIAGWKLFTGTCTNVLDGTTKNHTRIIE